MFHNTMTGTSSPWFMTSHLSTVWTSKKPLITHSQSYSYPTKLHSHMSVYNLQSHNHDLWFILLFFSRKSPLDMLHLLNDLSKLNNTLTHFMFNLKNGCKIKFSHVVPQLTTTDCKSKISCTSLHLIVENQREPDSQTEFILLEVQNFELQKEERKSVEKSDNFF